MKNCPNGLKYAFSGQKEIHPCVLLDIGPLGLVPRSHFTTSSLLKFFKYFFPFFLLGKHIDTSRLEEGLIIHLQFRYYVMGVGRLMTLFSKLSL